jgi:para-nitrobenzyl esterase
MGGTSTLEAVTTTHGRVAGIARTGHVAFYGIPYARAERFAPPRPAQGWSGVRIADAIGLACPQTVSAISGFSASGPQGEDCLNLNIFTPKPDAGRRPVMVWIHGGGFTHGAGYEALYNGGPLAARGDTVVVTINYRLGALGFLRLPEIGADGNQGLRDCIAALEWVRDNIAAFGGDPGNVTVFGESAGSAAIGCLVTMPAARGLFRRAIMQSGVGRAATPERADRLADHILETMDLRRDAAAAIRTMPVERLLDAQTKAIARIGGLLGPGLGPVRDGVVVPADPSQAIRDGAAKNVAIVIGFNRDEVKLFTPPNREPREGEALTDALVPLLPGVAREAIATLAGAYRQSRQALGLPHSGLDILDAVASDVRWRIPSGRLALAQRAAGGQAHLYLFTHASPARRGALGACHALEMPFVFGTLDAPTQDRFAGRGADVERLSREMMDCWLAFARDGDPSASGTGAWPAYDEERRPTMVFGTARSAVANDPLAQERRALEALM